MSHDFREGMPSTPLEALVAAQTRQADEEKFSSREALQQRLDVMVKQGIPSEVLDLIEALDTPAEDANLLVTQTYENVARSERSLVRFWEKQGNRDLKEQSRIDAEANSHHAQLMRTGEITIEQELAARREQRTEMGFPENDYTNLLTKPIFRSK